MLILSCKLLSDLIDSLKVSGFDGLKGISLAKESTSPYGTSNTLPISLTAALEAKDVPAITAAYEEAQELGLTGDKMEQAKPIVERGNVVQETLKKLEAATATLHLVDLNANLEKV